MKLNKLRNVNAAWFLRGLSLTQGLKYFVRMMLFRTPKLKVPISVS